MRLLTAVLKNDQVQEFIVENEDSAFDYLKNNLKIKDIYENVISNITYFINAETELEQSYNLIKNYSQNYTFQIIKEIADDVVTYMTDPNNFRARYFLRDLLIAARDNNLNVNLPHGTMEEIKVISDFQGEITKHVSSNNIDGIKSTIKNLISHFRQNDNPLSKELSEKLEKVIYNVADSKYSNYFKGVSGIIGHQVRETVPELFKKSFITSPKTGWGLLITGIVGAGAFAWHKLTQKDINDIPPDVKEAAGGVRTAMEQGDRRAAIEIMHGATNSKSEAVRDVINSSSSPADIKSKVIDPLVRELPTNEANKVNETWQNSIDWASTSKYGAAVLGFVAIGLILKYKLKRS